jgi:MraZ protein
MLPASAPPPTLLSTGSSTGSNLRFWEYNEHNLDAKGRLVLPASFRDEFEFGGILAFGGTHAMIHTISGWQQVATSIETSGRYNPRELAVIKSFATQFKPDAQNRVKVPDRLRTAAGLDREVALIGMGHYVALYSLDRWQQIQGEVMADDGTDDDLMERLSESISIVGGQSPASGAWPAAGEG